MWRTFLALVVSGALLQAKPVPYILDTDIASDCDDAGAAAMVNALADSGEARVLAMMVCTGGRYGAPALCAINTWYGHAEIPIGTLKNPRFWVGGGPELPAGAHNYESYNRYLAEHYPTRVKSGDDVPDARILYRQVLAAQPDGSVVINTIGPLINLANLMATPPDAISPLSGTELVRAKVKLLVIAGGRNPAGTSSNFSKEDAKLYTKGVIDGWPTPVVFVGNEIGHDIYTGWGDRNIRETAGNPARMAYKLFHAGDEQKKRGSGDQCGVLFAIRGVGNLFTLAEEGHQTCDADGNTQWSAEAAPGKKHAYLCKKPGVDAALAAAVEELMTQPRRAATQP